MSRRQSIIERARQAEEAAKGAGANDHKFKSSRPHPDQVAAEAKASDAEANATDDEAEGPSSRPNRRRDVAEEATEEEEDRFPWHFQFDDDEPEELQASSPLLSRAFRATIG